MANPDDLKKALIEAHKAGDFEAAELFASKIKTSNPQSEIQTKPKVESSKLGRLAHGMRDPILGAGQLVYNALPESFQQGVDSANKSLHGITDGVLGKPDGYNQFVQDREQQYRTELPKDEGFDEMRMGGNILTSLLATKGVSAPQSAVGAMGKGAAISGGLSATAPVTDKKYWKQKGQDVLGGTVGGAILGPLGYGIGRMISPKFANKDTVEGLTKAGVNPTVGQTLGGATNKMEQKLTSIPIIGDAITGARMKAQNEYNNAIINKAIEPINKKVSGFGVSAIDKAHKLVSKSYDDVLGSSPGFVLDDVANSAMNTVLKMSKNLGGTDKNQLDRIIANEITPRLSKIGGITSKTYRELDTKLGKLIKTNIKNEPIFEALTEIKDIFQSQAMRSNPKFAKELGKTKLAFKQMEAIKRASKAAGLQGGEFTPGQMVRGIKGADTSARGNSFARGQAPMQDYAVKAQDLLGNTVPNSATYDRMLAGGGLLYGGFMEPTGTLAGLAAGSLLYSPQAQKALIYGATQRPESAKFASEIISKTMPLLTPGYMMGN